MSTYKSYRKNETSLKVLDTIKPLTYRMKMTIRGWWITMLYTYGITVVLLYFAGSNAGIVSWVMILHIIIVLFIYFKNNKRNGRMFATLKEYEDVKQLSIMARPFKNILNFTATIIVLDALLWPVLFPIKFIIFWIFYRIFKSRLKRIRKLILSGGLVLVPDDEEIKADPFYNFLMQEGLYQESLAFAEEDDIDQIMSRSNEEQKG